MPPPGTLGGGAPEPSAVSTPVGPGLDGLGSGLPRSGLLGSGLPCAVAVSSSAFGGLPLIADTRSLTVTAPEAVTLCRVDTARP